MVPGEPGAGRRDPVYLGEDRVQSAPGDEHGGGVQDVLTRGALVDVARRVFGHPGDGVGERPHEWRDGVAGAEYFASDLLGVEETGVAAGDDGFGDFPGDPACPRLRQRQRRLRVEHRLQPRLPGAGIPKPIRDEVGPEQAP